MLLKDSTVCAILQVNLHCFEKQNNIPAAAPRVHPMQTSDQLEGCRGVQRHTNRSGKGHGVKADADAVLHNRTYKT